MDKSHVKAFLDVQLKALMELCGVPHWTISVEYDSTEDGTIASCTRKTEYLLATIEIDPNKITDLQHLVEVVEHELTHCLLGSLDIYMRSVDAFVPEGPASAAINMVWKCSSEQATEAVCRMLAHRAPIVVDEKGRLSVKGAELV